MTLRRDKKKESLTRKMLEHERYLLNLIKPIPRSFHSFGRKEKSRDFCHSILLKSEEKTYLFFFFLCSKRVFATSIFFYTIRFIS